MSLSSEPLRLREAPRRLARGWASLRHALAAALIVALPAGALACPDWQAAPHFGTVELSAGFLPDPFLRDVVPGGSIDLQRCFNGSYAGHVSSAPDLDLYWNGRSGRLTIAVESQADTVLLINDPAGNWWYSDDVHGLNPQIVFNAPATGLYNIWVGTYDIAQRTGARLIVTEMSR